MKRTYIYTTPHPTNFDRLTHFRKFRIGETKAYAISDMATPEQRAAKLDIADFLFDAARRCRPVLGAADRASQLAE